MDWFAKHTQWLYTETYELSNSSIYRENYQFIDATLISTGHIIVHKKTTDYYPILIVYPEATPYVPPIIYILENEIDREIASDYSNRTPDEIKGHVRANIRFLSRRHQNDDGSMCFVETGDLHSDHAELFTIKDIIKRLRMWLSGKIPKDSREVELFSHFTNKTYEIQVLIPGLFFDTEICKGKFYAGLSNILGVNTVGESIGPKTYMGITLFGENAQGVTIPPKQYINEQLILFTPAPEAIELIKTQSDKKDNAIKKGKLIEGYWWDINEEPQPFSTVESLSKYICIEDHETGIQDLVNGLIEPIKNLQEKIVIGIRFPGRWREKDWQFFLLKKGNRPIIIDGSIEEYRDRIFDYSIEAIRQEYFTDHDFHIRNKGRAERDKMSTCQLSIIGCGALGSEAADALSKAGIGKINLIDRDNLKAHNTVRHIVGLNRIALPKVFGLAEHIAMHNPFVAVGQPLPVDLTKSDISKYLPDDCIGISTIADDNIEAYLNEQAVEHKKTVFYCRALRGGKTARIFRVIPGKDACKSCLAIYSAEGDAKFIDVEEDESLPVITNECNNPIRPASAADMKFIAGIFSRLIIEFLHNMDIGINHWIVNTESIRNLPLPDQTVGAIYPSQIPPILNAVYVNHWSKKKPRY